MSISVKLTLTSGDKRFHYLSLDPKSSALSLGRLKSRTRSFNSPCVSPVSYTHLDVYKRQVYNIVDSMNIFTTKLGRIPAGNVLYPTRPNFQSSKATGQKVFYEHCMWKICRSQMISTEHMKPMVSKNY